MWVMTRRFREDRVLVAALQGSFYEDVCAKDAGVKVADRGSLGWSRNNSRKEVGSVFQLLAICEVFNGIDE